MSIERLWLGISPKLLTVNGELSGKVTIADACGFKVGMIVSVSSSTLPIPEQFKIKRIIDNAIWLGSPNKGIEHRLDMSGYLVADAAAIWAAEQVKPNVPFEDRDFATFEHEPINARRVLGVDCVGEPWGVDNPMPIAGSFTATIDLDAPTTLEVQNIASPGTANTEFVVNLPTDTKRYQIRVRKDEASGKLAFAVGETATKYWTLTRGTIIDSYFMKFPISSKFYMSLDKANVTLEVLTWKKV